MLHCHVFARFVGGLFRERTREKLMKVISLLASRIPVVATPLGQRLELTPCTADRIADPLEWGSKFNSSVQLQQ